MLLLLAVLSPFLLAPLSLVAERYGRNATALLAAIAPAIALIAVLVLGPAVLAGDIQEFRIAWLPAIGLELHFRLDGLALLFAGLIAAIGLLVVIYGRFYLSQDDPFGRFYCFLLLFMGSMLGIVLAGNLLLIAIFWELTSISSFLLIGYWHHDRAARQGARMALAVTGLGGLALIGGIVLLGSIVGSFDLNVVLAAGDRIVASPLYIPTLLLIFLGAATKSAQFPFHFWLPHAMAAPTPVSAYLHSATMVKAGVFLLARLHPALAGHDAWFWLVGGTGALTAFLAAYWAIGQKDLKGLLAYSTIGHLGLITALFGFGTPLAALAGVLHILNHAAFKAALFMTAGIVDHETGSRDLRRLGGLRADMPRTALVAVLAGAAMAGIPPLGGFISKELFFEASLAAANRGGIAEIFVWLALGVGIFGVAYTLCLIWGTFFGRRRDPDIHGHEPAWPMRLPVEILAGSALIFGLWPGLISPLVLSAGSATAGQPLAALNLGLWHGFNLPLAMSGVAVFCGFVLFRLWPRLSVQRANIFPALDAKAVFDSVLAGLLGAGRWAVPRLAGESLHRYTWYIVLCATAAFILPFAFGISPGPVAATPIDPVSFLIWLLLVIACLTTVRWYRSRLAAIVALSVIGLIVALTFARFSAPDLALTQLSVEVVMIVLLLLALGVLPEKVPVEPNVARHVRDGLVAVAAGSGTAWTVWTILTRPLNSISDYYLEQSVPGGGGSNVVNVILVDFRGFDTLGEIAVLGVAALGVYALLHAVRPRPPHPGRSVALDRFPIVLSAITRPLLPITLLVAIYMFLRGHNAPGGGFVAGLIASVALVVQYMASGSEWARDRMRILFAPTIGIGIAIATLTGLGSFFFGKPFLTSAFAYWTWPIVGKFEVATAALFDLGVFLVVLGASLLILTQFGRIGQNEADDDAATKSRNPWNP